MNDRLEIAARYLMLTSDHLSPSFRSIAKNACDDALFWADALIAAERETRKCETCVKLLADPMWESGDRLQCPYCGTMTVKA